MKKSIKIIMVVLLIILMSIAIYLRAEAAAYTNWNDYYYKNVGTDASKIIGKDGKVYDLDEVTSVSVVQYGSAGHSAGEQCISILEQPNVWCVEKGKRLGEATYTVEKKWRESQDLILTYILAHPPTAGKLETNHATNQSQNALWRYLSDPDVKSEDKTNILSNISCGSVSTDKGITLYGYAKDYANAISTLKKLSINDFRLDYDGKNIIITPTKTFSRLSKFEVILYVDNAEMKSFTSKDNKVSIDTTEIGNAGEEIKLELKIYYNTFKSYYKILTNENNKQQRLIVSKYEVEEGRGEVIGSIPFTKPEYAVSLEKYITKVYSETDDSNYVTYDDRSGKRYNEDAKEVNENGEEVADLNNQNTYKVNNPVEVEVGDIVEYTIKVTNTGKHEFNLTEITDDPNDVLEFVKIDPEWNYNNGKITPTSDYTLEKADFAQIKICFKVNDKSENKIENKAKVIENKAKVTGIYGSEIGDNDKDGLNNNADADFIKLVKYSVSLQKYISRVEDTTIYDTTYDINYDGIVDIADYEYIQKVISRLDETPTDDNKWLDIDKDGKITVKDAKELKIWILNNTRESSEEKGPDDPDVWFKRLNYNNYISGKTENASSFKYENPVEVEIGDTVTYTIKIKNTGKTPVKVTQIYDKPEENLPKGVILTDIEYVSRGASSEYEIESISDKNEEGKYIITFKDPASILNGKEIYIDVKLTVSYNENYDGSSVLLRNEAGILEIKNSDGRKVIDADGDSNNHDCDFVKVKKYAVSLEKFIIKVTDKDGKNFKKYNAPSGPYQYRYGRRYNDNDLTTEEIVTSGNPDKITRHPYKVNEDNYVQVEVGDKVTFNVRLKNTGEAQVKITEIEDVFTNENGVKLKFESGQYNGEEITFSDNNKIVFADDKAKLLEVNEILDIQMTFSVEVSEDKSNISQILENKAKIITIKNKDNIPVTDADGTSNNADKDILKTKTYAVSLEKFITDVRDAAGQNIVTYKNRFGKRYNDDSKLSEEEKIDENDSTNVDKLTRHSYKNVNKVQVEAGDIVTFRIRLKNTGNTPVKITQIYDSFIDRTNGIKLAYVSGSISGANGIVNIVDYDYGAASDVVTRYLIQFNNAVTLQSDEYKDVEIKFKVIIPADKTTEQQILQNKAGIVQLQNRNGIAVGDSDGKANNYDKDWLVTKIYKVSLEKYVSKVTKQNGTITTYDGRDGSDNTTADKSEHKYDNDKNTNNQWKYNNPVTVEKGDKVTYTIKIKNDGETDVKLTNIADYLPDGVLYQNKVYTGNQYAKSFDVTFNTDNIINNIEAILLKGNSMFTFTVEVEVIEPNISVNILKNVAEIVSMVNKNNVNISDSTPNNNRDADYIQMKDIIISGTVWEDLATDKTQNNYDGLYNNGESKLAGIKVYLYRSNKEKVETTITDDNGNYSFALNYIKGAKVEGTNRWAGTYYAYYLVFEYDGIKYTSTNYKDITSNNELDSNAQESLTERTEFNNKFSTINNSKGIEYITKNEKGNIPQSNYVYNPNTMSMHSSTSVIILSKNLNLEAQLKHINLGLKGRNIFDLELTSDVYKVDVKVNNQDVEYLHNNKVTLRESDVYVDRQNQYIRNSDKSALNSIYVTYKITVTNASQTAGAVTKITNYYDNKYTFIKAYSDNNEMTIQNGKVEEAASGNGFESVIITTPEIILNQSDKMEVYVVYQLNNVSKVLENVTELATYNMAEIEEYKTYAVSDEDEYTRGLIDKDSAPGSANTEQVRLATGDLVGRSTVGYYFNAKNLNLLKYEDDTYATPTLYFVVTDENVRTITGTVFEDKTTTNPTTRIKTGNGKLDEGEIGIFGAKVELIKQVGDEKAIIDTKYTDENGKFEFINFLPGNYIIRYYYGDTKNTIMKGQQVKEIDGDGNIIKQINAKSYNGEDFQSTNNSYIIEKMETNKLSERENFWYLDNEEARISTARDDTERRKEVTANVINTEDDNSNKLMMKLNAARAGILTDDELNEQLPKGRLIDQTYMFADTKEMLFTVEKSEVKGDKVVQGSSFGKYIISNMNFGIAEVPVTTVDLQKTVKSFTLTDSTGNNTIASVVKNNSGKWELKGDVIAPDGATSIDVSVEDEKLQGARLQVTYAITSKINTEKNYDGKEEVYATITELIDYIDNNLSYNSVLGDNSKYWEITTYNDIFTDSRKGTVDPEGKLYTTVVKAKAGNPILNSSGGTATITLEKVLSSTDSTLEEIITSTVDTYEYNNTVEITGISYENAKPNTGSEPRKDLVRTEDKYIILARRQHDSATAETITIHPPTGDSSINIMYYILAAVSLVILAGGIFGIKKFVLTNRKS